MRGTIRYNANLHGFRAGQEVEVEIDDRIVRLASTGLVSIVDSEGDETPTEHAALNSAERLMAKKNVVGVAGGEDRVLVLVEKKQPLDKLAKKDVVDEQVDDVETDVIEVGKIEPMLKPGASIGLSEAGTGTLGGVVVDEHGRPYALTNNHVAADSNRAKVLTEVHHPGNADGLGGRIGVLGRFEPIYFDRPNLIDAALVALDDQVKVEPGYSSQTTTGRTGWTVRKTGRTSGETSGKILGRGAVVDVSFGRQGVARFVDQLITDHMLDPGDSGSVLLSTSGHPIGLGFAGSDEVSIHTPINLVLRTLGVRFAS